MAARTIGDMGPCKGLCPTRGMPSGPLASKGASFVNLTFYSTALPECFCLFPGISLAPPLDPQFPRFGRLAQKCPFPSSILYKIDNFWFRRLPECFCLFLVQFARFGRLARKRTVPLSILYKIDNFRLWRLSECFCLFLGISLAPPPDPLNFPEFGRQ